MTSKAVPKQLAMKLKLENKLKPKLKKFFRQVSHDVKIVMTVTRRVPSLENFDVDLTAILKDHYREVAEVFKEIPRESIKSWAHSIEKKQHVEEIPGGSDSAVDEALLVAILLLPDLINQAEEEIVEFIITHSQTQSRHILNTTQKELNQITARVIAEAAAQGEVLTPAEISARVEKEFNARSKKRIDTIATTETQTPSEKVKLITALALAAIVLEGTTMKTWHTVIDSVTRPAHISANGQVVRNDVPFRVGGERLPAPGDSSLGASPKNIINCRCIATYSVVGGDIIPANIALQ